MSFQKPNMTKFDCNLLTLQVGQTTTTKQVKFTYTHIVWVIQAW